MDQQDVVRLLGMKEVELYLLRKALGEEKERSAILTAAWEKRQAEDAAKAECGLVNRFAENGQPAPVAVG